MRRQVNHVFRRLPYTVRGTFTSRLIVHRSFKKAAESVGATKPITVQVALETIELAAADCLLVGDRILAHLACDGLGKFLDMQNRI
jgi:hypothetical protein